MKSHISVYDVKEKILSLKIGQMIRLRQYNLMREDAKEPLYYSENCKVVGIYPHVVVFQRPNGMKCSRTGVELVMADRGHPI